MVRSLKVTAGEALSVNEPDAKGICLPRLWIKLPRPQSGMWLSPSVKEIREIVSKSNK